MTRFLIRVALPACICLLLPVAALAQPTDGIALAPLLSLLLPQWAVYAPAIIGIASLLDAVLPHVAAGSWLAVPRSLITTLAGNIGNAANARGQTLLQAISGLRSRVDTGASATTAPDTVRRDTEA